jgi:hypothetical protein
MTTYAERITDILEVVDKYQDEIGQDSYAQLALEDLDYLADELQIGFDELVGILREQF